MEHTNIARAEQAYDAYAAQLYRVAYSLLQSRECAEDAVQDAFARYLAHDGHFRDGEHEKAWLIRVTVNACRDLMRSFFRSRTISMEELNGWAPDITREKQLVLEALWSLPKQYRDVIYLHFYEGYTAPEIAGILNRNPNTVYTHLRKGKELLKEALGGAADG